MLFRSAFSDLNSKMIFVDGVQLDQEKLSNDNLLAVEAHEIAHALLNHRESNRVSAYDERQEREADWLAIRMLDQMGHGKSAALLEERYQNYYNEPSDSLTDTKHLENTLVEYLK